MMHHIPLALLLIALAVGAGWWLLADPTADPSAWDEEAAPDPVAEGPTPTTPPTTPPIVSLPVPEVRDPGLVLPLGVELPPPGGPDLLEALHLTYPDGDPLDWTGPGMVQAVAAVVPLRFLRPEDLEAVRRLEPDPEWPRDERISLGAVIELWARSEYELEQRGQWVVLTHAGN